MFDEVDHMVTQCRLGVSSHEPRENVPLRLHDEMLLSRRGCLRKLAFGYLEDDGVWPPGSN